MASTTGETGDGSTLLSWLPSWLLWPLLYGSGLQPFSSAGVRAIMGGVPRARTESRAVHGGIRFQPAQRSLKIRTPSSSRAYMALANITS